MKPKNIAVAGCGAIAREHLNVIRKLDGLNLIALCDADKNTVMRVANQWNVRHYYTAFADMLKSEDISLVSILTPPQSHAQLILEAINRGVNVLVEKPLTMSSTEAQTILASLAASKLKLTVDYSALTSNVMTNALALLKQSVIGQTLGMDVRMLQTQDDPMASNEKHWCHKLPGGRFGEMLSHPVYLLQSVLGNDLKPIHVLPDKRGNLHWMRYDELHALLQGPNGVGHIYVSFNAPRPVYLIDIYGTERILEIDLLNQTLLTFGSRTFSKIDSAVDTLDRSRQLVIQTLHNSIAYIGRERAEAALLRTYSSLLSSVEGKGEPIVTPEMAYHTVRIVEQLCQAIE